MVDLLGWGGAAVAEGSPAASTSNTTSSTRNNTCVDTDDNAADFAAVTPTPQNTATRHEDCVAPPPVARPDHRRDPGRRAHLSPLAGKPVADVPGVVTVRGPQGFWMQSATPRRGPGTSEGIYVFTRTAPTVAVGDSVTVSGTVTEFRPGGATGNDNTTTTEIVSPAVTTTGSGTPLPAPVVLGVDRVAPAADRRGGRPAQRRVRPGVYRPATDGIDFYESLEGMRVGLRRRRGRRSRPRRSVRSRWSRGRVSPPPGARTAASSTAATTSPTPPGCSSTTRCCRRSLPSADVGDSIPGRPSASWTTPSATTSSCRRSVPVLARRRPRARGHRPPGPQRARVATFNVENLAPDRPAGEVRPPGRAVS